MGDLVPYEAMAKMAADVAKSGLFGIKNETQALALMAVAQAEGKHPATVARDYDIIQNRPAKKAEAMLRDFIQIGGKVQWHKLDDTCADATFSHEQGGTVRITWDMERAKNAGLVGKVGDMYKKYPRQMLRSRTISEGVRTVAPLATSGFHTVEEVHSMSPEVDMGAAEVVEKKSPWAPDIKEAACTAAQSGTDSYLEWWKKQTKEFRQDAVNQQEHADFKKIAADYDKKKQDFVESPDVQSLVSSVQAEFGDVTVDAVEVK